MKILVAGLSPQGGPCWLCTLDFRVMLNDLGATCPDGRADNRRLRTSRWVLGLAPSPAAAADFAGQKPDVNGVGLRRSAVCTSHAWRCSLCTCPHLLWSVRCGARPCAIETLSPVDSLGGRPPVKVSVECEASFDMCAGSRIRRSHVAYQSAVCLPYYENRPMLLGALLGR